MRANSPSWAVTRPRALIEMRSTIAIMNTSLSGQGQSLTLVGYSSVLPKIAEARLFKSDSRYPSQRLADP